MRIPVQLLLSYRQFSRRSSVGSGEVLLFSPSQCYPRDGLCKSQHLNISRCILNAFLQHGQQGLPDRSAFWKPHTLGYQFLAEAKRLWELQRDSRKRITTLQAGAIICVACNIDGIDKVGASYLAQSIVMGVDMGLFSQTFASRSLRQRTVYAMTAWSLFAWQA